MSITDRPVAQYVELPADEMRLVGQIGMERWDRNRANGRRGLNGQSNKDVYANMLGAWGEAVIAKAADHYWMGAGTQPDHGAPDVGIWHVRTATRPGDSLLLQPNDADNEPFVLVVPTDRHGVFRIAGWCHGREGKDRAFWQDPVGGRPCFFVPQSALRAFPFS
jgi:hypothetical protein